MTPGMTTVVAIGLMTAGVTTVGMAAAPCHRKDPSLPAAPTRGEASMSFDSLYYTDPILD